MKQSAGEPCFMVAVPVVVRSSPEAVFTNPSGIV